MNTENRAVLAFPFYLTVLLDNSLIKNFKINRITKMTLLRNLASYVRITVCVHAIVTTSNIFDCFENHWFHAPCKRSFFCRGFVCSYVLPLDRRWIQGGARNHSRLAILICPYKASLLRTFNIFIEIATLIFSFPFQLFHFFFFFFFVILICPCKKDQFSFRIVSIKRISSGSIIGIKRHFHENWIESTFIQKRLKKNNRSK